MRNRDGHAWAWENLAREKSRYGGLSKAADGGGAVALPIVVAQGGFRMRTTMIGGITATLLAASLFLASPGLADQDGDADAVIGCSLLIVRDHPAIQEGTKDDDHCSGVRGRDIIKGHRGDDHLRAMEDRDVVRGQRGDDVVRGGHHGDLVAGGMGDDRIKGGFGWDLLVGGIGHDDICLGPGHNIVMAEDHRRDRIFGANDDDVVYRDRGDALLDRPCPF
jgi:Ca2+-binding RTX toxin-like protein